MNLDFNIIVNIIETRRQNAYVKVNEELILMYWDFGKYVSEITKNSKHGEKCILQIVDFMKVNYPKVKGFNRPGIYRMKQFYETYKDNLIVSPLVRQISWTNNLIILSSTKTMEEKEFYIRLCIKYNYSKRELERQIKSGYYERYLLSPNNIKQLNFKGNLNTKILDTYSLEFLNLPSNYSEKDLKTAIIKNLKLFILEIGNDFAFLGEEFRVNVGGEDYYIDLLFYNRKLSCLVAFELKQGPFKPEYVSKMNFYLEALDKDEREINENPSVGVILCSDKNETIVNYSLSRSISSTLVSKYKLELIDKKLLERKIEEIKNSYKKKI